MFRSSHLDPAAVRKETAISLLRSMGSHFPGDVEVYVQAIQAGQTSDVAFSDLGRWLAEWSRRQQADLQTLRFRCETVEFALQGANRIIQELQAEPVRQEFARAEAEAIELRARVAYLREALAEARDALDAEQSARLAEADNMRAYIAQQNRIIAQQQLRLNHLLGETPVGESAGEKS